MGDRWPDRDDVEDVGAPGRRERRPTDVGRTMGGGSLGHAPAEDVSAEAGLRNNPPGASSDTERLRRGHDDRERHGERNATGSGEDPAMPADDATLKTKI